MTLRSILSSNFTIVALSAFLFLPKGACALESLIPQGGEALYHNEKIFEEKIDSLISKRMNLPLVRSKLDNGKLAPVYGNVIEVGAEGFVDDGDDWLAADSLFNVLNEHMMLKNEFLLRKASPEVQKKYKRLSNRFNFINLEKIRIHVDYYYDRAEKKWVRPATDDSIVTMTMIIKSGYFLYQDSDSLIDIRRYGYYIPSSNVKRIFFGDGYSEVLWKNPNEAVLDSMKVLPYKLVEKIVIDKNVDEHNRMKIKKLLKNREFAYIPLVLQEMDEYCKENSCTEIDEYKRYLNTLDVLYRVGVLGRN